MAGERKFTFRTAMVATLEKVIKIIVKSRYLPNNGTVRLVGGMISAKRRKNTTNESIIEMERLTWWQS